MHLGGPCHHALYSRERFKLRVGMKKRIYHLIGELKSVQIDRLLMILDYNGSRISLFQLQMAVQLEIIIFWFLMDMEAI